MTQNECPGLVIDLHNAIVQASCRLLQLTQKTLKPCDMPGRNHYAFSLRDINNCFMVCTTGLLISYWPWHWYLMDGTVCRCVELEEAGGGGPVGGDDGDCTLEVRDVSDSSWPAVSDSWHQLVWRHTRQADQRYMADREWHSHADIPHIQHRPEVSSEGWSIWQTETQTGNNSHVTLR